MLLQVADKLHAAAVSEFDVAREKLRTLLFQSFSVWRYHGFYLWLTLTATVRHTTAVANS